MPPTVRCERPHLKTLVMIVTGAFSPQVRTRHATRAPIAITRIHRLGRRSAMLPISSLSVFIPGFSLRNST